MKTEATKKIEVTPYDTIDYLKSDEQCVAYLQAALDEDEPGLLAAALGDVMRARVGNISDLARRVEMSRFGLYKALSSEGNPSFSTVARIAREMGLNVVFAPAAGVTREHREVRQVTKQNDYAAAARRGMRRSHTGTILRNKPASGKGRGIAAKADAKRSK